MNESKAYLGFLKRNFAVFLLLSLAGLLIGIFFGQKQVALYNEEQLFEMKIEGHLVSKEIEASVALIDHLVTVARSPNLASELSLTQEVMVNSVRFSPFAFKLVSTAKSREPALKNLQTIGSYLETRFSQEYPSSNYQLERIGIVSENMPEPNRYLFPLVGMISGFVLAFFVSLIKTYLKNY